LKFAFLVVTVEDVTDPLDDRAVAALAHELRTTSGRLTRALRERGGRLGLTASQSEALGFVDREGPMTVTALAKRIGIRPQSAGATIAALEEQGLVVVSADPDDGRQKVIAATERAHDLVEVSRTAREDWLAERISTALSAAEQHRLQDAVAVLARLVSD